MTQPSSGNTGRIAGPKKLYIATFGCQMNEYDSQKMMQLLGGKYVPTEVPDDADLILINTCSIREKAEHKVYSLVGRFRPLKEMRPDLIIGVGGCVAQQEGETLLRRLPHLDLVFGPRGLYRLPSMIRRIEAGQGPILDTGLSPDFAIPRVPGPMPEKNPLKAFVTIMQGCDNFCTYCIVPHVRGREISRRAEDVVSEVRAAIGQGAREVTLLGQNVNSYGRKDPAFPDFASLLRRVCSEPGLDRLRFTTSHPKDLSEGVMTCFRDLGNLCNHLHLPVQSGSSRVLKRMNRHYTREHYLETVDKLRRMCPDITLTTDIIVGFPGESREDFEATISLLETIRYDQIFAFKYSPRPLTRAAAFDEAIADEEKDARLAAVLELQQGIGLNRYQRLVGQRVEVLVEGPSKGNPSELLGRTQGNHVVNFPGAPDLIGRLLHVDIQKACYHSLRGAIPEDLADGAGSPNLPNPLTAGPENLWHT